MSATQPSRNGLKQQLATHCSPRCVVTFDEAMTSVSTADDVLGLDSALESLAKIEPRQAMMVESRFFGGLDVAETAALLQVSEATVLRDWRAAKAWLARELRQQS